MASSSPPPCRLIFRSKDGVEVFEAPSSKNEVVEVKGERSWLLKGPTTLQLLSPDGTRAYVHQSGVGVVMCTLDGSSALIKPLLKDSERVQMLALSPKGTYLVSWERPSAGDPQQPNLKIWNAVTGDFLHGFVQKNLKREGWPYLHWTHDENYAFLLVTNEIRVYEGHAFGKDEEVRFVDKMRCPGIAAMSIPKTATTSFYLVTSFVPNSKDRPARASLHKYPSKVAPSTNATNYPALLSKSLYQADEAIVHWSPRGDAALMAMQTSVDTSGESYYGSTTLYLLAEESSDVVSVPLPNNSTGPVLDVAWMPNPAKPPCFAVVSGRMPAMASLHHGTTAEPLFIFGNAHRNTIAWSSHGRFVCLAGFGNLAGGMTFWDRNKLKPIPQYDAMTGVPIQAELKASCTVGYGWSPDSRLFCVSTTSPRMNVDNGVRLFRYNGEEVLNLPWDNANYKPDRLLEATFVPAPEGVYPDRPQSPAPPASADVAEVAEAKQKIAQAKPSVSPAAGRYVPPSARGRSSGNSLAERMRREKEGNMLGATKVVAKTTSVSSSAPKGSSVVGLAPVETKSKNAEKKEKQRRAKAKQAEEEARKKAEEEAVAAAAAAAAAQDPQKRARKINKMLKQIEELKASDPSTLNDDQKEKISNETNLREELTKLKI